MLLICAICAGYPSLVRDSATSIQVSPRTLLAVRPFTYCLAHLVPYFDAKPPGGMLLHSYLSRWGPAADFTEHSGLELTYRLQCICQHAVPVQAGGHAAIDTVLRTQQRRHNGVLASRVSSNDNQPSAVKMLTRRSPFSITRAAFWHSLHKRSNPSNSALSGSGRRVPASTCIDSHEWRIQWAPQMLLRPT